MTYIIDIETTGLDRHTDRINLVGIMDLETGQMFQAESKEEYLKLHTDLGLEYNDCVFHNAKFDTEFLRYQYQVDFKSVLDTMIMFYLYNPYRKFYALKGLVADLFKVKYDVSTEVKTGTSEEMKQYNKQDLQYTGLLYQFLVSRLSEKEVKLSKFLAKIDLVYSKITEKGVLLDRHLCTERLAELEKKLETLSEEIKKQTGDINLNSPKQLGAALFSKLGYEPKKKTAKGEWSLDTDALKSYGTDLTDKLVEYRKLSKIISSFFVPYQGKDTIHPIFRVTGEAGGGGTVSGRTSCSKPNLQQLPRGPMVRNLLRVPSDEWYFFEIDYSQMELRCAGQIAQVKALIDAYREGRDVHTETAKFMTGKEEITDEDRFQAKAANFGLIYGMGAEGFVDYARNGYGVTVSLEQAKKIREDYFKRYPELHGFYKSIDNSLKNYGYVENPIGRRRRVYGNWKADLLSYRNTVVQGFASDLLVLSLLEVSEMPRYGQDFYVVGTVHDSILGYVRKDKMETLGEIAAIMENPKYAREMMEGKWFDLPIKADVSVFEERWYGKKVKYE